MSSSNTENSSAFSFLGRLLSSKPSRLHGTLGGIYSGMCQELEPQRDNGLPQESWNAYVDPRPQSVRYRSDSDSSVVSAKSTITKTPMTTPIPTFDVPKWTWPATELPHISIVPISESLKPAATS